MLWVLLTVAEGVHKIIGNKFHKNAGGALRYSTVGEKNPGIVVTGMISLKYYW